MSRVTPSCQETIEGYFPEGKDDLNLTQYAEFPNQISTAGFDFSGSGLVGGRGTPSNSRYAAVAQFEAVFAARGFGLRRKAKAMKSFVQPIPTAVSGKHTARSVSAVRSGGQTHDQKSRSRIAESRKRLPPIVLVGETPRLAPLDVLPVLHEPRAAATSRNESRQRRQGFVGIL